MTDVTTTLADIRALKEKSNAYLAAMALRPDCSPELRRMIVRTIELNLDVIKEIDDGMFVVVEER